ncbi:MAG: carboxymuconolactone decarboxylase family protein [Gammaproteobacteria bacterium]|nr:carboxymuconolactone decarboxylase family protein [Gammaproteobacteria bacterium]
MTSIHQLPEGHWYIPEGSNLPDLPIQEQGLLQRLLLKVTRKKAKSDSNLNVFLMLARLGAIFPRYLLFLSHLLMKGRISRIDKELLILHTAWRLGCVYEWGHHVQMAKELGISDEYILSMASSDSIHWSERTRTLLKGVDELIDHKRISAETWRDLSTYFNADQLVEFCILIGHYIMVAITINSTGVCLEAGYLES